jgi:hypothetical protein
MTYNLQYTTSTALTISTVSTIYRFFSRFLDMIYNHSIKKLPIVAGKLGELDPHSTGRNRVIRPMHIYPDYFRVNRKTAI